MARRHPSAVVVAALLAVSACAGIPTSGPVTKVGDDPGFGESTVRYSPAGPVEDSSPQQIVRGYLDAMLAYPVSSGTAAKFLTPEGADQWSSSARVRVYGTPEVSGPVPASGSAGTAGSGRGPVEVRLGIAEDARLDRQGHYTRIARPTAVTYRLEQVRGEWRIANPQVGMLVNRKFFDDYFRRFDIFFFDRPGQRLVPDPIHLAVGDQLATGLVSSLVRGPRESREHATRTYVPPAGALRPSVPVSQNGVADVEFSTELTSLPVGVQNRLSAQIVWTLRQVPGVTAMRLVGGASTLSSNGSSEQQIDSWGRYGPSIARGHAYAIAGGRVVQIDDGEVRPLEGAWGKNARDAVSIGVSDEGVAAVLPGQAAVRVTNRKGTSLRTFGGAGLIAPRWDGDGNVWLVDRPGPARVRLVTGDGIRTLDVGRLAALDPATFALSPDGSRYAVTAGTGGRTALHVGSVLRDAKDRVLGLGDPSRVHTTARAPRSAMWSSGTELSYLAESETGRQVYTSAIDGSSTTGGVSRGGALLPDVGAAVLAIGAGETPARYATDARDRLWYLPAGESWRLLSARGVTGLTYGR